MFYDERGKHRRTKKNVLFKVDRFLDEVKRLYTDLINVCTIKEEDKLHVFDRNGMYLATKKAGKNNPKAEEIEATKDRQYYEDVVRVSTNKSR